MSQWFRLTLAIALGTFAGVFSTTFDTAANETTKPWRFMVTGDSRGAWGEAFNQEILSEMAAEAIRLEPAFVLFTGDLVYYGNEEDFYSWKAIWTDVYDMGIAVYPAMGNHDSPDPVGFKTVFGPGIPDNGPLEEIDRTYFVAKDNVLVLVLDVYANENVINQPWIDSVLATNTRPHVFAMAHPPAFKVAHYDCLDDYAQKRDAFWRSLAGVGARAYFAGHDHFYDHMRLDDGDGDENNDVHQYIVGTAGAPNYEAGPYDGYNGAWTPTGIYHEATFGYVLVEINGLNATLTWHHRTGPGTYEATDESWSYTGVRKTRLEIARGDSATNVPRLKFATEEGQRVVIEASRDLQQWKPISTNTVTSGMIEYQVDFAQEPYNFFRVR